MGRKRMALIQSRSAHSRAKYFVWTAVLAVCGGAGCSLSPPGNNSLSFQIPDMSQTKVDSSALRAADGLINPGLGQLGQISVGNNPAPTGIASFSCMGVMVTAPDITPNQTMLQACSGNNGTAGGFTSSQVTSGQPSPGFSPGPGMPSNPGIFGGLVPVTGGSINLTVPSGASRLIQLFAVQTTIGCPMFSDMLACVSDSKANATCALMQSSSSSSGSASSSSGGSNIGDPVEIGRTTTDILQDVSVSIKASFNPASPKLLFSCGGGGNGGGNPIVPLPKTIPGLTYWMSADTLSNMSDGMQLSDWGDLSGNGNDFAQGISAEQPIFCNSNNYTTGNTPLPNGKPVVHFNGSTQCMLTNPISQLNNSTRTLIVVAQSQGGALHEILDERFTSGAAANSSDMFSLKYNVGGAFADGGRFSGGTAATSSPISATVIAGSTAAYHVFSVIWRANGNLDFSIDGGTFSSQVAVNATPGGHIAEYLGVTSGFASYLPGEIAEIIMYNAEIPDASRQQLESYLQAKYATPTLGPN